MEVKIPELALVVLVGPSGSGKSTLARMLFKPTEVISSDFWRGLVSDDENNQAATNDAFEVLHSIARKRLRAGKLTVIDATNVCSACSRWKASLWIRAVSGKSDAVKPLPLSSGCWRAPCNTET
jgi:hypothetical protein